MRFDDKFELRVSLKKLLIGLTVSIVPISIAGLYITTQSTRSMQQTVGTLFRAIAQAKWDQVSQFLNDHVVASASMAADEAVREAIAASNNANRSLSQEAIQEKTEKIAAQWNSPADEGPVSVILASKASQLLRRNLDLDTHFQRIIVSDERGLTVAATAKPAKYLQSEETYWHEVFADGEGSITSSDVRYDEATKATYITIAVPIRDERSGTFLGAVYSQIDVAPLFILFNNTQLGSGMKAILTKGDGTIIASQNTSLAINLKPEEYPAVRDGMGSLQSRQVGFITSTRGSVRTIVGFADAGLKEDFLKLGWIVMVSQDQREATAAIGPIGTFALTVVALSCLMLILLMVYFFLERPQEFEDIETLHGIEAETPHHEVGNPD
jgi:hypothetical protein